MEKDQFKKLFPHLTKELEGEKSNVNIDNNGTTRKWAGHVPDTTDFIRRCDTEEQAEEIIDYLVKKDEISSEKAAELLNQLHEKGIRSFGSKKNHDFYHKDI